MTRRIVLAKWARSWALPGLCALSVGLAGCGDDTDAEDDEPDAGAADGATVAEDFPSFNGCTPAMYDDQSADDGERTVAIAQGGLIYTPKCLTIAKGQTVRWQGSLSAHPLSPGNPEDVGAGTGNSPITPTSSGNSVEFTFDEAGTFPYHCTIHAFGAGMGMAGSIHVK